MPTDLKYLSPKLQQRIAIFSDMIFFGFTTSIGVGLERFLRFLLMVRIQQPSTPRWKTWRDCPYDGGTLGLSPDFAALMEALHFLPSIVVHFYIVLFRHSYPLLVTDLLSLRLVGWGEELIITTGARHDPNSHPDSHGCEPSSLPLCYFAWSSDTLWIMNWQLRWLTVALGVYAIDTECFHQYMSDGEGWHRNHCESDDACPENNSDER